jgi:chromosome segregation ATPase
MSDALHGDLSARNQEAVSLLDKMMAVSNENQSLKDQLDGTKRKNQNLRSQIEAARDRLSGGRSGRDELERQISILKDDVTRAEPPVSNAEDDASFWTTAAIGNCIAGLNSERADRLSGEPRLPVMTTA